MLTSCSDQEIKNASIVIQAPFVLKWIDMKQVQMDAFAAPFIQKSWDQSEHEGNPVETRQKRYTTRV